MPMVSVTPNLQRHVPTESARVDGNSVRDVLESYFSLYPKLRAYVLNDSGAVRKHMIVFVDNEAIADRENLSDSVDADAEVFIMQSLSGG